MDMFGLYLVIHMYWLSQSCIRECTGRWQQLTAFQMCETHHPGTHWAYHSQSFHCMILVDMLLSFTMLY